MDCTDETPGRKSRPIGPFMRLGEGRLNLEAVTHPEMRSDAGNYSICRKNQVIVPDLFSLIFKRSRSHGHKWPVAICARNTMDSRRHEMSITKPSRTEIVFVLLASRLTRRSRNRKFVEEIGLKGKREGLGFRRWMGG